MVSQPYFTHTKFFCNHKENQSRSGRNGHSKLAAVGNSCIIASMSASELSPPLITTKLYRPRPRPDWIPRPRLLARLDKGLAAGRRLSLISAPAGFGKTSLASAWVASLDRPVAWLGLNAEENDPIRFWTYLVAALQRVTPNVGGELPTLLRATPPAPLETIIASLVNTVAAEMPACVLVLDDWHLIKTPAVQQSLAGLVQYQPANLHLLTTTRSDPALPLARLRGRQQMTELRADDLRFELDETRRFLHEQLPVSLSAEEIGQLQARTEGWITGLQMAALSLRQHPDPGRLVSELSGTQRYILDYLMEEVLARAPADQQTFLLETSILERLSGPLCAAVTGRPESESLLEQLESDNLFLQPLDDQRHWYRYHRLFADLLQARAAGLPAEHRAELHRRASRWLEANDLLDDAVRQAHAGDDLVRVAELTGRHGLDLLLAGELTTLESWIQFLPEEMTSQNCMLFVLRAWVLLLTGRLQALAEQFAHIAPQLEDICSRELIGHLLTIRGYAAMHARKVQEAASLIEEALSYLSPDSLGIQAVAHFVLGGAAMMQGQTERAAGAMDTAARLGKNGRNVHLAVAAINALAGIRSRQGRLQEAEQIAQEGLALASDVHGKPLPIAGGVLGELAELAYERNDLPAALELAQEAVEQSARWGNADSWAQALLTCLRIQQACGHSEEASESLHEVERLARGRLAGSPVLGNLPAPRAWLDLKQNRLAAAAEWARAPLPEHVNSLNCHLWLIRAEILLALDRPADALADLDTYLTACRAAGFVTSLISGLVLQALARQASGRPDEALPSLQEALELAAPRGVLRRLIEPGPAMIPLLEAAKRQQIQPELVATLLTLLEADAPAVAHAGDALVNPLSERELEVLQLVAEGLTNREIAGRLYIAASTVKSHLNSILRKLDASNRTQAAAEARALGILQD
jgi:LuxR family maltose regulon positive regulatory protein